MPGIGLASITLAESDGSNVVNFDVDPVSYRFADVATRGSSHQVLDGTQIHQVFGLHPEDFVISFNGIVESYDTLTALWKKYAVKGGKYILTDWYPNKFNVIFEPGSLSINPEYYRGSNRTISYSVKFRVLSITSWFGSPNYP